MKSTHIRKKTVMHNRKGVAFILALIFLSVFATLGIGMLTMSSANAQLANNHHKANGALTCAESGAEVLRHWMEKVTIPSMTPLDARFGYMEASLQTNLAAENITNISVDYSGTTITISDVALDDSGNRFFSAEITPISEDYVQMIVRGSDGSLERNLDLRYSFGTRYDSVFDYGVATKGPLHLSGNIDLTGYTVAVEASVYIESPNNDLILSITGNSQIAGDVSSTNPNATVDLQGGQAGIGGETGQDAIDNHVFTGVASTQFPTPNPDHFVSYVGDTIIDSDTVFTSGMTFTNARIAAGTNPSFSNDTTFLGVLFIETPNQVSFTGSVDIQGIIIGDGDVTDDSGTNTIDFGGNVSSVSVAGLVDDEGNVIVEPLDEETFGDLSEKTGTFIMAPGFAVSMGGSFGTVNGAIAANGIEFYGNAGGEIVGSVLNYSDEVMEMSGNADLIFNRSGTIEIPAGFEPESVMRYNPEYYSEVIN